MQKLILHFGEDPDIQNIYNLIVKIVDVPTDQLVLFRDDLQNKGFEIYTIAHNSIEAMFTGDYLMVLNTIRQLDKEGWVCKESTKISFNSHT